MIVPPIMVVERALRDAGIPIDGVSIGDPLNRATWKALYGASATPAQRTQGDNLLTTVDPQDPTILAEIKADVASSLDPDVVFALGQALWEAIPAPVTTLAQTRARFFQLLRARL